MSADTSEDRIVVTGAAGGVGRAAVSVLLRRGAKVCATDVSPAVHELSSEQNAANLVTVTGDVTRPADIDAVFTRAEEAFGGVDCLVSNAGFMIAKPVHETSLEEWDTVLRTNATSFFLAAKRVLPAMLARGSGLHCRRRLDLECRRLAGAGRLCRKQGCASAARPPDGH